MTNLPQIPIYKFNFQLEALEDMVLPQYKGSMFRGAFGIAFRNTVCVTKFRTCDNCLLQSQCSYFNVFETEVPDNNLPILKNVKKHPHPFVINPPLEKRRKYKKGEILNLGLTILGSAINQFPYFLFTIIQMGKRGISSRRSRFEVLNVSNISIYKSQVIVYKNSNGKLINNYKPLELEPELLELPNTTSNIKLKFKTPLRIQDSSQIIYKSELVNFELIYRNVIRRITLLSALFCGQEINSQFKISRNIKTIENNLLLYQWQRFSNRQKEHIEMNGFTGEISFEEVEPEAIKFIKYASYFNIGKNTVFGLGEFELEIL